jgi:hypothetical protein
MELFYNISYKNLDYSKLDEIHDNINSLSNIINNKESKINLSDYNLDNNEEFSNKFNKNKNFIKKANFYIKKDLKNKIYNIYCLICLDYIFLDNCNKFNCNHLLCKECYIKWEINCNTKNSEDPYILSNLYCPLCKK